MACLTETSDEPFSKRHEVAGLFFLQEAPYDILSPIVLAAMVEGEDDELQT